MELRESARSLEEMLTLLGLHSDEESTDTRVTDILKELKNTRDKAKHEVNQ